jgi:ferrous iron transport protein B
MKIMLVGNQNSGKTTLFNCLVGTNQKTANWPGVTIERKAGILHQTDIEVIDLPGIYSLSPYSPEEEISRQAIFDEKPDLIINIVDVTSIERSLYLTTQLLELDIDVVIALNMSDMLIKKGLDVNVEQMEKELLVSVIPISALRRTGINELIETIIKKTYKSHRQQKIFDSAIEKEVSLISQRIESNHPRFVAIKLLEEDRLFIDTRPIEAKEATKRLSNKFKLDVDELIADQRYRYIVKIKAKIVSEKTKDRTISHKLDNIFLNKYASIPIFVAVMFLVYFLSIGVVGGFLLEHLEGVIELFQVWVQDGLTNLNASPWSVSLVVDGIIAGAGAVIVFAPQLIILFLLISLLESTGYISRVAFVLDRLFYRLGMSGKTLIPFIIGSGCSVPGIMATRTIEQNEQRSLSILLTPFVPCAAKLPIIALFAGFFFPNTGGFIAFSLYIFAVVVIILSAFILHKLFFKKTDGTYIVELPEYRLPNPRYIAWDVYNKTMAFVKQAGTIIVLSSLGLWLLASFDIRFNYGIDIEDSILAHIGRLFAWLFYPMFGGEMSWGAAVAAIQGLIAKENVVAAMAVIAGLSAEGATGSSIFASEGIFGFITPITGYAFLVFNLFSAPCIAAIGAMKKEFQSWRKMFYAILFQTGLAWILASLIGGIGSLIVKGIQL